MATRRPAVVLALLACCACGPIEYVNQVSRKASSSVEAARAVRADQHAPYWYTLAVEYLEKAREEASLADYQAANRFGRRSREAAERATELSLERLRKPAAEEKLGAEEEQSVPAHAPDSEDPLAEKPGADEPTLEEDEP